MNKGKEKKMPKWEDTVMGSKKITEVWDVGRRSQDGTTAIERIAQSQAKITWPKAEHTGYDKAVKFCHRQFDLNLPVIMETSELMGMQKVVEFFEDNNDFEDKEPCPYYVMNRKVWQAYLKKTFKGYPELLERWGIK